MGIRTDIDMIFPKEVDVPAEYRLAELVEQRESLINGEFRSWQGPLQEVLSPLCMATTAGPVRQVIGRFP